jgi:DNA-binding CsgD family transcriptional regulator/PAS domain-containing protein
VFQPCDAGSDPYTNYYLHIDPIRSAIAEMRCDPKRGEAVVSVDEVVNDDLYRASEFYQDFARHNGREHMMIGLVGDRDNTIMSFFRQDRAFGATERKALGDLMPHVRRGLRLRETSFREEQASRLLYAAFDTLPGNVLVVDGDCNLLFANASATKMLSRKEIPISFSALAAGGRTRLVLDRRDGAKLRQLVQETSRAGEGGAIRFEYDAPQSDRAGQLAVFASPMRAGGAGAAPVLLLMNELSQPCATQASIFSELFGLSAAEGAVAAALLGGQTAETVAKDRCVSLDTVRTQIRTVLRKTDAANLRDFERMGALLGAFSR